MKNTYPMTQTDTLLPTIPRRLEGIIIRNYPTKYSKVIQTFKDYLDGTPHITKYCAIKCVKYNTTAIDTSKWDFCNVKPENIYIFPYYHYRDYWFLELFFNMRNNNDILAQYVICPTFNIRSENPLEYYNIYGDILIDQNNLKYIQR